MNFKLCTIFYFYVLFECYQCGIINTEPNETNQKHQENYESSTVGTNISQQTLEDVEGEKPAAINSVKTKRCHRKLLGISSRKSLSPKNDILGSVLAANHAPLFNIRRRDVGNAKRNEFNTLCIYCRNQDACRIRKQCDGCDKYCNTVENSESKIPVVSVSNRFGDEKSLNRVYPIATLKNGQLKNDILVMLGIKNISDIDTLILWVTTKSNNPPSFVSGTRSNFDDKMKIVDDINTDLKDAVKDNKLSNSYMEDIVSRYAFSDPFVETENPTTEFAVAETETEKKSNLNDFIIGSDFDDEGERLNPDIIEDTPDNNLLEPKTTGTEPQDDVNEEETRTTTNQNDDEIITQEPSTTNRILTMKNEEEEEEEEAEQGPSISSRTGGNSNEKLSKNLDTITGLKEPKDENLNNLKDIPEFVIEKVQESGRDISEKTLDSINKFLEKKRPTSTVFPLLDIRLGKENPVTPEPFFPTKVPSTTQIRQPNTLRNYLNELKEKRQKNKAMNPTKITSRQNETPSRFTLGEPKEPNQFPAAKPVKKLLVVPPKKTKTRGRFEKYLEDIKNKNVAKDLEPLWGTSTKNNNKLRSNNADILQPFSLGTAPKKYDLVSRNQDVMEPSSLGTDQDEIKLRSDNQEPSLTGSEINNNKLESRNRNILEPSLGTVTNSNNNNLGTRFQDILGTDESNNKNKQLNPGGLVPSSLGTDWSKNNNDLGSPNQQSLGTPQGNALQPLSQNILVPSSLGTDPNNNNLVPYNQDVLEPLENNDNLRLNNRGILVPTVLGTNQNQNKIGSTNQEGFEPSSPGTNKENIKLGSLNPDSLVLSSLGTDGNNNNNNNDSGLSPNQDVLQPTLDTPHENALGPRSRDILVPSSLGTDQNNNHLVPRNQNVLEPLGNNDNLGLNNEGILVPTVLGTNQNQNKIGSSSHEVLEPSSLGTDKETNQLDILVPSSLGTDQNNNNLGSRNQDILVPSSIGTDKENNDNLRLNNGGIPEPSVLGTNQDQNKIGSSDHEVFVPSSLGTDKENNKLGSIILEPSVSGTNRDQNKVEPSDPRSGTSLNNLASPIEDSLPPLGTISKNTNLGTQKNLEPTFLATNSDKNNIGTRNQELLEPSLGTSPDNNNNNSGPLPQDILEPSMEPITQKLPENEPFPLIRTRGKIIQNWSNHLGNIVRSAENPNGAVFLGDNIKLPLRILHDGEGNMNFAVDLDKLCSCKNDTCQPENKNNNSNTQFAARGITKRQTKDVLQIPNKTGLELPRKIFIEKLIDVAETPRRTVEESTYMNHENVFDLEKRLTSLNRDIHRVGNELRKNSKNAIKTGLKTISNNEKDVKKELSVLDNMFTWLKHVTMHKKLE